MTRTNTYEVTLASDFIPPIHTWTVLIKASSAEEAREKAHKETRGITTNVRLMHTQEEAS